LERLAGLHRAADGEPERVVRAGRVEAVEQQDTVQVVDRESTRGEAAQGDHRHVHEAYGGAVAAVHAPRPTLSGGGHGPFAVCSLWTGSIGGAPSKDLYGEGRTP